MLTLASLVQVKKECFVFGLCPKNETHSTFLCERSEHHLSSYLLVK
jgi:hypothetical protein